MLDFHLSLQGATVFQRKKAIMAIVTSVTLGFGLVAVATPAQATPGNCNVVMESDGTARGSCYSGTGQFRTGLACKGWINFPYAFSTYGDWKSSGNYNVSVARCPVGSWAWSPTTGSNGPFYPWIEKR